MRVGFKSEAERSARQIRDRLGAGPVDPLPVHALFERLGVRTLSLQRLLTFGASTESIAYLHQHGVVSAFTLTRDGQSLVVVNERHSPARRRSDQTHECAHLVLGHPSVQLLDDRGLRKFDAEREDEADWLTGALLVPRDGAVQLLDRGLDHKAAAEQFGVSLMFSWRANATGAALQVRYRDAARRRGSMAGVVGNTSRP